MHNDPVTVRDDEGNPTRGLREEDAFDVVAAAAWLREHAAGDRTELAEVPEVRQYGGGASNLTYLLRYPGRDLVLRRPPAGTKAAGAHDMAREFRLQAALHPVFPRVPRMVALCEDESVLGAPFYVMDRVPGTILRKELPAELSAQDASALCSHALDVLIELHGVDVQAAGLGALGRGSGYVERQVGGWSGRFRRARTEDVGDFEDVMAWLEAHRPDDVGSCLIHNDFRFDNLVLDADDPLQVVAVLDWELATVGDPLMDLGSALAYWVEPGDDDFLQAFRRQPTTAPGMWTRAQVVAAYGERTGRTVTAQQWLFYEVFGLFRVAVIAQQIHYRYVHGQTTNEAFATFGPVVGYLEARCRTLAGL